MNCWPAAWIAAAKKAGLLHGSDANEGYYVGRGGDDMREALAVFAQAVAEAAVEDERKRLTAARE